MSYKISRCRFGKQYLLSMINWNLTRKCYSVNGIKVNAYSCKANISLIASTFACLLNFTSFVVYLDFE